MIQGKKSKKIKLIFIVVLMVIIFIWVIPSIILYSMKNTIQEQVYNDSESLKGKILYNIVDLYEVLTKETYTSVEINIAGGEKVIYNNVCNINFEILDFSEENDYNVKIYLNDDIYIEEEVNDENYNLETIEINDEGENNIKVEIYKNDTVEETLESVVYYIKPYEKQFLDELSNKGVVVHYLNESWEKYEYTSELLINLGVKNIRTTFSWKDIERKSGEYDFSYYDKWIEVLTNNNINIVACFNRFSTYGGEDGIINTDDEVNDFLKFANTVIERYPQIYEYELFNEANINGYYTTEENIAWYAKILKELSENENIEIITSGTSTPDSDSEGRITSQNFYKYLFENGGYNFTNNFAFHPYDSYDEQNLNERLYMKMDIHNEMFKEEGGFYKQYITEYGIHFTDLDKQADRIIQQMIILDSYNVEKSIIYNLWSTGTDTENVENNYGLITNDYLPKESYYAVKKCMENTNGAEYIGTVNLADGLEAHVYDKDGKAKIIVWSNNSDNAIQIDYTDFTATDIYGEDIENTDGTLEITTSPVYLDNISDSYFYKAISNTALEKYEEFEEKFATEIASVDSLQEEIDSLKQYMESISSMESESESVAKDKMEEHFNLGNLILEAYKNKSLDVEYVKLSSMLDMLNDIGDSFEDLVTVTATARNPDLEATKTTIDETEQEIESNSDIEIVYPTKILEFSKDLYDDAEYINSLEEENDIKTGLIVSYDLHAKYLADWANTFTNIYIDEYIEDNPITVSYSETSLTNENVTVTLNISDDTTITNNEGNNTYTFEQNGTFIFEYERRGRTFNEEITVDYIDKTSPVIYGVEDGTTYSNSVTPQVSDEHLKEVQLTLDGKIIEDYVVGSEITEEGKYELTAIDEAGNETKIEFEIQYEQELESEEYIIDGEYILGVSHDTPLEDFKEILDGNVEYIVYREEEELQSDEIVATGDKLVTEYEGTYYIIVRGDINKDGKVDVKDLVKIRKNILSLEELDEFQTIAADLVEDEEVNIKDLVIIRRIILGLEK